VASVHQVPRNACADCAGPDDADPRGTPAGTSQSVHHLELTEDLSQEDVRDEIKVLEVIDRQELQIHPIDTG
jgi:hypothetical protein